MHLLSKCLHLPEPGLSLFTRVLNMRKQRKRGTYQFLYETKADPRTESHCEHNEMDYSRLIYGLWLEVLGELLGTSTCKCTYPITRVKNFYSLELWRSAFSRIMIGNIPPAWTLRSPQFCYIIQSWYSTTNKKRSQLECLEALSRPPGPEKPLVYDRYPAEPTP